MSNSENENLENNDNQAQIEQTDSVNNQNNENNNDNINDNQENKDNQEEQHSVDIKDNQENKEIQINENVQDNKDEVNNINKQEYQNNKDIQDNNNDNQNDKDKQETSNEKENNINNENKDNSEELSPPQENKDDNNNNNFDVSENKDKNIEQNPSQPNEYQVYFPSQRNLKSKNKKRMKSMDNYLSNSLSASIFLNQSSFKEPEHKPKLCFKPEKVYLQELKLKKYQFDIYRAQFVKLEHDTKIKQREYLKEQKKKIQTPLNIPSKLKQSEVKMLNFLHRSKSPYSNKWTDFMLMKNYNSQMKILGFLNGVPKYEIVKLDDKYHRNKGNKNLYRQQSSLNSSNSNKYQKGQSNVLPVIEPKTYVYNDGMEGRNDMKKKIAFPKIYEYFKDEE